MSVACSQLAYLPTWLFDGFREGGAQVQVSIQLSFVTWACLCVIFPDFVFFCCSPGEFLTNSQTIIFSCLAPFHLSLTAKYVM